LVPGCKTIILDCTEYPLTVLANPVVFLFSLFQNMNDLSVFLQITTEVALMLHFP